MYTVYLLGRIACIVHMRRTAGRSNVVSLSVCAGYTDEPIKMPVKGLGPDLQNILRQSYDYLTIMPKLRSTYDISLIYKISYNEWKAFHW